MQVRGMARFRRAVHGWRWKNLGRAVVFLYHRVTQSPLDPLGVSVTSQHFAEQLKVLGSLGQPMALTQLVDAIHDGKLPRRSFAITFDDGYAGTLYTAKQLLEGARIPATAFLVSGYLGREFWWDELASMLLEPGELPETLHLTIQGKP